MQSLFHSTILATTFAATVAVGIASAAILSGGDRTAAKADRLPVIASNGYVTVETRVANVSTLERLPAGLN
ncbi:MAG TPA: hypothetical protein VFB16_08025 [Bauldia sp.]|nr:hypothetical protein [Bauldia sp.]